MNKTYTTMWCLVRKSSKIKQYQNNKIRNKSVLFAFYHNNEQLKGKMRDVVVTRPLHRYLLLAPPINNNIVKSLQAIVLF